MSKRDHWEDSDWIMKHKIKKITDHKPDNMHHGYCKKHSIEFFGACWYCFCETEQELENNNQSYLSSAVTAARLDFKKVEQDFCWVKAKLGLPRNASIQDIQGEMHILKHKSDGFTAYIESYKCDDKQGEIARLTKELEQCRELINTIFDEFAIQTKSSMSDKLKKQLKEFKASKRMKCKFCGKEFGCKDGECLDKEIDCYPCNECFNCSAGK